MATVIKLSDAKHAKRLASALKAAASGVDTRKYSGVIKLKEDAVKLQRRLRDEWE
jgi:hypothetical protein